MDIPVSNRCLSDKISTTVLINKVNEKGEVTGEKGEVNDREEYVNKKEGN